jgi:hypothetical protein
MLIPKPWSRVNDQFIRSNQVDATPVLHDITHALVPPGIPNSSDVYCLEVYQHVALDIVTETVFNYPYPYISEKTYRPIVNQRMFVIVGAAGTLATLQRHGFETWSDIINEDYDAVQDPEQRFLAVVDAVTEFCQLPLKDIQHYMQHNQARFEHNYQLLLNLETVCLQQVQAQISRNLVKQKLQSSL